MTDRIWARKEFIIDDPRVSRATLAIWARCETEGVTKIQREAALLIEVNGHTSRFPWPKERSYWETRASPIDIPVAWLKQGLNNFVFHSADSTEWYLLIEDCTLPNRSARSVDGGSTWDYEHLGQNGGHDGEYLMRLQLEGYPPEGVLTSPSFDIATIASGARVGRPCTLAGVKIERQAETPPGTAIDFEVRGGSTPSYEPFRWTNWLPLAQIGPLLEAKPRFLQWRAFLKTTNPQLTPLLSEVRLSADVELVDEDGNSHITIGCDHSPTIARSSYHFAYQPYGEERLHLLRKRWCLDRAIEGAKSELEELVRLCDWTRRQWEKGWNSGGELKYCPPWDRLVARELARRGLALGMCTHYATVFIQACLALGFVARHNVIRAHCVAEVWSNQFQKWVMFDPGCDMDDRVKGTYHLESNGVPMSTLEAHRVWLTKDLRSVEMVPELYKPRFALDTWLQVFERFCITLREDELTSLSAGEPENGGGSYHFDGYLWWEDEETQKLEWFTLATNRVDDMYWGLNQVEVHLMKLAGEDVLLVTLDTVTPNFASYEAKLEDEPWHETGAEFPWELHPGDNLLAVRAINRFGRVGPLSSVVVSLLPLSGD